MRNRINDSAKAGYNGIDRSVFSAINDVSRGIQHRTEQEEMEEFYETIGMLPIPLDRIIVLSKIEGTSNEAIADVVGVSRQAIDKRLDRILKNIREIYDRAK